MVIYFVLPKPNFIHPYCSLQDITLFVCYITVWPSKDNVQSVTLDYICRQGHFCPIHSMKVTHWPHRLFSAPPVWLWAFLSWSAPWTILQCILYRSPLTAGPTTESDVINLPDHVNITKSQHNIFTWFSTTRDDLCCLPRKSPAWCPPLVGARWAGCCGICQWPRQTFRWWSSGTPPVVVGPGCSASAPPRACRPAPPPPSCQNRPIMYIQHKGQLLTWSKINTHLLIYDIQYHTDLNFNSPIFHTHYWLRTSIYMSYLYPECKSRKLFIYWLCYFHCCFFFI